MRVLILDNYDSFTYNLYQNVGEILSACMSQNEFDINVQRNDEIDIESIKQYDPHRIIISPGPGNPADESYFGVCAATILDLGKTIPLLGVCLGMQGITHCFGGKISLAKVPMHGKVSEINHDGLGLFDSVPQKLEVMRYHSLIVESIDLPECLTITSVIRETSTTSDSLEEQAGRGAEIMGIRHKTYPIVGVQFHPESFATEGGKKIITNFLGLDS